MRNLRTGEGMRQGFAGAVIATVIAVALGTSGGVQAQSASFVTRSGTSLVLDGEPYRFTGINIYNANNTNTASGCWYSLGSGPLLGESLDELGAGAKVIRAWFFQGFAMTGGARDWSAIDHTLAEAEARGTRVIATLANQWKDCDGANGGAGSFKDEDWYTGGYTEAAAGGMVSYRDWVAEIVNRYKNDPTILAWQLVNEAEVKPSESSGCSVGAASILKAFATDVSGLVKSIDPNHLVSLGTIGGGQCGAQDTEYHDVHDVATIDLCEYHDYGSPTVEIPGDQWNGLQRRLDQCNALGKPLFVGEVGIDPDDLPRTHSPYFPLVERSHALEKKLRAQFAAGVVGELVWAWSALGSAEDTFDIGAGDPVLSVLTLLNTPSRGPIERVSVSAAGAQANARSVISDLTPDGRYVLFSSEATNLSPDDIHHGSNCARVDTFLKDRATGAIELVSVDSDEVALGGFCGNVGFAINPEGRYVLFQTDAYRSTGGQFGGSDMLLRDRLTGTTRNLTAGANGNTNSNGWMSRNGRYAVFTSNASNLVPGTPSCAFNLRMYVYDLLTDEITLASVDDPVAGCNLNGANLAQVSDDGRYVTFQTDASLVPEDNDQLRGLDVYLRDLQTNALTLVSREQDGSPANGFDPALSADGRFVAYVSASSNIVPGDTNGPGGLHRGWDVFVYDRVADATERVSVDGKGHELEQSFRPSLSAGGRFVAFTSGAELSFHAPVHEVLVRDRQEGTTERIVGTSGLPGGGIAELPRLSPDGRFVHFTSSGAGYVTGDTNGVDDIFVHERSGPRDTGGIVEPPGGHQMTDRPDDLQGKQVHVMYVLPSDAEDRELDLDGTLVNTVDSFQRWLASQTGGRALRLDTFGGELDVTFFQLSRTDEEIAGTGAFVRDAIEAEIEAAGFTDPDKLYAVYYDGSSTFACGGGAFPPSLPGSVAAMYLNGLPDGPVPCSTNPFAPEGGDPGYMEYAMLHEIVHTLGFVASCAPNNVRVSHVGTPANDLMYAGDDPWDLFGVVLDDENDDYYGHDALGCLDLEDSRYLTSTFPDGDADGIEDAVDTGDATFADADGTSGEVETAAHLVSVEDAPAPDGVRVRVASGSVGAELRACGFRVSLSPGSEVVFTCGSITVEVVAGAATVALGDGVEVRVPEGGVARITSTGPDTFTVENQGEIEIQLVVDGTPTAVAPGATTSVGPDTTPPVVTPTVTGTLGSDGWYRSDVVLSWTVVDPESAIGATHGCETRTISEDTNGVSITCAATSSGGTSSATATVKRDATAPSVVYSGNAGTYQVDALVSIACTASDAMSGLATNTCVNIVGPAYNFALGQNTFSASATDRAGNASSASTSFTVSVTPDSLCTLTRRFVETSPKYLGLPPSARGKPDGLTRGACEKLSALASSPKPAQKAALISAYIGAVDALANGGWLTPDQAATLSGLARTL